MLCHDEIARRESQAIGRWTRRAQFEEQSTLEGFDFAASPKLPAAQIRDLAALRWLAAGESVVLYGPAGVGKTMLHKHSGTWQSITERRSSSPRPAESWPPFPAGTPTAAGTNAYAN